MTFNIGDAIRECLVDFLKGMEESGIVFEVYKDKNLYLLHSEEVDEYMKNSDRWIAKQSKVSELSPEQKLFQAIFGWRFTEPYRLKDNVQEALALIKETLGQRIWRVLELRFGFDGEPQTLQDIANIYQVTRERIRQIQQKGLRLLRHPSRSRILRDWIQEDSYNNKP